MIQKHLEPNCAYEAGFFSAFMLGCWSFDHDVPTKCQPSAHIHGGSKVRVMYLHQCVGVAGSPIIMSPQIARRVELFMGAAKIHRCIF